MNQRYFPAFVLGILVTLGLFGLMQFMILNSQRGLNETNNLKMVEFVRLTPDNRVATRKRRLPEKPPPKTKPPPPQMKSVQANPSRTPMPRIDAPNLDIPVKSARVVGSLLGGLQMGASSAAMSTDLVPIFRVPPQYPMRAAKRRVEGWVRVEFTINDQGHVTNPVVVESYPSNIFNRAATKAISKWKFKPKVIGGVAVEQRAIQVLEFKLGKKSRRI